MKPERPQHSLNHPPEANETTFFAKLQRSQGGRPPRPTQCRPPETLLADLPSMVQCDPGRPPRFSQPCPPEALLAAPALAVMAECDD